ncbi:Actin-related protein 2/3 complex subunit 1A [Fukomys damarensis]|uniref:Actin-related protein 2/3 complex subunit 1A n=1 Tax=Fukomys damarensis TaxID=885580 RepID=A0A091CV14_FUKDA|nr:Actin-related protein 2/3 complex subunit 1A [Fukomys damarensis]
MLFNCDEHGCLAFVSKLDIAKQRTQGSMSAVGCFHDMDKGATTENHSAALETLHHSSSDEVNKQDCHKFHTSGINGATAIGLLSPSSLQSRSPSNVKLRVPDIQHKNRGSEPPCHSRDGTENQPRKRCNTTAQILCVSV